MMLHTIGVQVSFLGLNAQDLTCNPLQQPGSVAGYTTNRCNAMTLEMPCRNVHMGPYNAEKDEPTHESFIERRVNLARNPASPYKLSRTNKHPKDRDRCLFDLPAPKQGPIVGS